MRPRVPSVVRAAAPQQSALARGAASNPPAVRTPGSDWPDAPAPARLPVQVKAQVQGRAATQTVAVRRSRVAPVAARAEASSRAAARRPCSDWPHALVPAWAGGQAVAAQRPPSGPAVASAEARRSMREAPSPRAVRRPCSDWPHALVLALVLVLAAAQAVAVQRPLSGPAVASTEARRP